MRGPLAREVRAAHGAARVFWVDRDGKFIRDGAAPCEVGGEDLGRERGFFLRADDGRGGGGSIPREGFVGVKKPGKFGGHGEDDAVAQDNVAVIDEHEVARNALHAVFGLEGRVGFGGVAGGPDGAGRFFVAGDFAGGRFGLRFLAEAVDEQGVFRNRLARPFAVKRRVVEFAVGGVDREAFAVGV